MKMTQFTKLALALILVAIVGGTSPANAQPATQPVEQPTPPAPTVDPCGPITDVRLGEMLDRMGLEVKRGTYTSGARYFDLPVATADYDFTIRISLSPNKRVIWLMTYLGDLPPDVPAERLRALLEAINSKTGKLQFRLVGNQLKVDQPLDNFAVTPARLRREIDDLKLTVQATCKVWDAKKWETKPVNTNPVEPK
jgi:hypothetical protein